MPEFENKALDKQDSTMDAAVCQCITYFHIYQDGLMWGRLQTLGLIQAATIGSEYALKKISVILTLLVGFVGAALSLLLLKVVRIDEKFRDINLPELAQILKKHGLPNLVFTEEGGTGWGGFLLQTMIVFFAVIDLILTAIFLKWIR